MRRTLAWVPFGLIPAGLAALAIAFKMLQQPAWPALIHQGFQSFIGVMMLLLQL
jgi:hypothetical protein